MECKINFLWRTLTEQMDHILITHCSVRTESILSVGFRGDWVRSGCRGKIRCISIKKHAGCCPKAEWSSELPEHGGVLPRAGWILGIIQHNHGVGKETSAISWWISGTTACKYEVILPLLLPLVGTQYCVQFWLLLFRKDVNQLESSRSDWRSDLERLKEVGLFSLEKRSWRDLW